MDAGDLTLSRLCGIHTRSLSIRSGITSKLEKSGTQKMSGQGGRGAGGGGDVALSMSFED